MLRPFQCRREWLLRRTCKTRSECMLRRGRASQSRRRRGLRVRRRNRNSNIGNRFVRRVIVGTWTPAASGLDLASTAGAQPTQYALARTSSGRVYVIQRSRFEISQDETMSVTKLDKRLGLTQGKRARLIVSLRHSIRHQSDQATPRSGCCAESNCATASSPKAREKK